MNRRKTLTLLAILISGVPALKVSAGGFRLPDQDAFATARGEAFAATADNPSAIYYNPAGITQLEGNNLRAGFYGIYLNPTFTPPAGAPNSGTRYENQKNFAVIPQLFYTFTPTNLSLPLSFGLGVYAPYGLGLRWPQDTGFRTVGTESALSYIRINPVVALKLGAGVSVAAGLTVNYSSVDLEQGLTPTPTGDDHFRFKGDGWSVGYNLGVLWQPIEKISMGASFRSATSFTMDGHTDISLPGLIPPTHPAAHADFTFPLSVVAGLSYRPTPKWNVEFNADYMGWDSMGTIVIHQISPPFPFPSAVPVIFDWQPSWLYEFGVTRYLDNGWHVSAGYVFNQNSVPDAHYSPLVADLDRHFFSVGTGFKGKTFDFDFAYQFGVGFERTVKGSAPSTVGQTADGNYDWTSHAVLLTVGMHF
jgi:long-chain fatty acid transport protein